MIRHAASLYVRCAVAVVPFAVAYSQPVRLLPRVPPRYLIRFPYHSSQSCRSLDVDGIFIALGHIAPMYTHVRPRSNTTPLALPSVRFEWHSVIRGSCTRRSAVRLTQWRSLRRLYDIAPFMLAECTWTCNDMTYRSGDTSLNSVRLAGFTWARRDAARTNCPTQLAKLSTCPP